MQTTSLSRMITTGEPFQTPDPKHGPIQVRLYQHPFHTVGIDYVGPLP